MTTSTDQQLDLENLARLNADYLHADQHSDVARFQELLAEDFTASLPDYRLRDRTQFLELIGKPRPFTGLTAQDVRIRLLGDFAIIHAHMTFTTLDGVEHEGRYTDDWQRRDGRWVCVAANVIAIDVGRPDGS